MNRFISGLRRLQLRRVVMVFLGGLLLLVGTTLGQFTSAMPAAAATLTPEAEEYQTADQADKKAARAQENAERVKAAEADAPQSIGDKLNLDESVPESTQKFFKQVKGEDVEVKEEMPPGRRHNTEN